VREDAVDTYIRSRGELLKSILDGADYDLSVGNYIAAQINLERHGYVIEKTTDDLLCDYVVRKELSDEQLAQIEALRAEAQGADLETKFQISDKIREIELSAEGKEKKEEEGDVKERKFRFRRGAEFVVPNHTWTNGYDEHSLEDSHALWPNAPFDELRSHGGDKHPMMETVHPHLQKNHVTGYPNWIQTLHDFYLPSEKGGESLSQRYAYHESAEDKYHRKKDHGLVNGEDREDVMTGKMVKHQPYLGPLEQSGALSHLHDIYERNYHDWKESNPKIVDEITKENPITEDHEFLLRQMHFKEAAEGWMNEDKNINFTMGDYAKGTDIYDLSEEEMAGYNIRGSLGHKGYLFGLEFLKPKQRHLVMRHLHEKGSDAHDAQVIDIGDGQKLSMGRIKRNIAQRFTPEFLHYQRSTHISGPNMHPTHVESDKDHPKAVEMASALHMIPALYTHEMEDGRVAAEHLLDGINNHLYGGDEEDEEGNRIHLSDLPDLGKIAVYNKEAQKMVDDGIVDTVGDGIRNILRREDGGSVFSNHKQLLNMVGYNESLDTAHESNAHPIFPDFDQPFLSKDTMEEVMKIAGKMGDKAFVAKDIRNGDSFHYLGVNGPRLEDIDPDFRDAWLIGPDGHPVGLSAHFARTFQEQGGRGRSPLSLLQIMHQSLPKDDAGFSLIGRIGPNGMFEPNQKTLGLFGRYLPILSDKHNHELFGSHGIQSLWESTSPQQLKGGKNPRTLKNRAGESRSNFSKSYANKTHGKTQKSINAEFGQATTKAKDSRLWGKGFFSTEPLMAIGGMGQKATQTINNARNAHARKTAFGHVAPPHKPNKTGVLTRLQMMRLDEEKLSHGDAGRFGEHQNFSGKRQEEMDLSSEEIESMEAQMDVLIRNIDESKNADEKKKFQEELHELERNYENLTGLRERGQSITSHFKDYDNKRNADKDAIFNMAKILKPIMEEADPTAFDTSNPEKAMSNMAALLQDANRALLSLPHEAHGLTTYGYDVDMVPVKSASSMLSTEEEVVSPHASLASLLIASKKRIDPTMSHEAVIETLGFPDDEIHREVASRVLDQATDASQQGKVFFAMNHGDILASGAIPGVSQIHQGVENHHDELERFYDENIRGLRKKDHKKVMAPIRSALTNLTVLHNPTFSAEKERYGVEKIPFTDMTNKKYSGKKNQFGPTGNAYKTHYMNKLKSQIHDVFSVSLDEPTLNNIQNPEITPEQMVQQAGWRSDRKITPAWSTDGEGVQDAYISGMLDSGREYNPTVGFEFGTGQPVAGTATAGQPRRLPTPSLEFMNTIGGEDFHNQIMQTGYTHPEENIPALTTNPFGQAHNDDPTNIALSEDDTLAVLMNPDVLLKASEGKPPPIFPMHRIFSIKDFDALRGFSGEWAVSSYPGGQRMIVQRKSNQVSAYDENGESVPLTDNERKYFRKIGEKNFLVDAARTEDEIHIIDIIEYDNTNVADMNVRERLKVLRGQFDSHETVLVPGPHNLRLTDHEGLDNAVKDMTESHPQVLLRDATSTYMRGERRHPKWFVLRPDKNIPFIILDVRGKGPYTYRLGAGPLDAEGFGNRGVEYEGESYLDVGTVRSPKAFEEGEIVSVGVSGVRSHKRNGSTIYTVTPTKIRGECESAASSLETLSLLTKSHPIIPVEYSMKIEDERIILSFPELDDVIYKMEQHRAGRWVHSPVSSLGELMKSEYPTLLAESVRPLWSEAVALMVKGVKARSMTDPKHRERSEKESAGVIDADDDANILKPQKAEAMVKTLLRIADLVDRIEKEKMSGRTSAQGLGIFGDGVESPRGPTRLTSEQSMPDWDMLERPTEDPEEEYPGAAEKRKKAEQYDEIEVGDAGP